jgi:DNA-binding CsgD family transcriptional regulator
MQPPIRVFIVAENEKEIRKMRRIFEEAAGFAVAGSTVSATSAGSEPERFDVRIVEVRQLTPLVSLSQPSVPTLYVLSEGSPQLKELSGPNAVLPENATPAQVRAAVMALGAGLQIVSRIEPHVVDNETEFALVEPLTDRELHILNLLADGLSNPQIARRLEISRNTVKFHVSSIISKLGATSRTEAVTIGVKRGLIIL